MADTYVKLFHAILTSSIWSEDDKTRIMWVTILALADRDGYVSGTIPGLASMARMSVEDAEAAIGKLAAPDKYSRTPDHDGRRIEPTAGGWRVINYVAYRELGTAEVRRSKAAERVAKFRERQKAGCSVTVTRCNADVTRCNGDVTQCNGDVTLSPIPYTLSPIYPENREGVQGDTDKPKSFKQWTRDDLTASVQAANTDGLLLDGEVADFVDYWTEPTASGRFRITLEKTWDTRRRMKTALSMIYERKRTIALPGDEHPIRWVGGAKMWEGITDADYERWGRKYIGVAIDDELVKLSDWLVGKPEVAKKQSFCGLIEHWLGRAQERGGR